MDTDIARRGTATSQDLEPDYHFWMQKDVWQLLEAAKLVCGRDPSGRYPGRPRYNTQMKVIGVIDLAYAAVKAGELPAVRDGLIPNHVLLEPKAFLKWSAAVGLTLPAHMQNNEGPKETATGVLQDMARERAIAVARTLWMVDARMSLSDVLAHRAMRYVVADERFTKTQIAAWVSEYQPQS